MTFKLNRDEGGTARHKGVPPDRIAGKFSNHKDVNT